jgi:hypothetical protein
MAAQVQRQPVRLQPSNRASDIRSTILRKVRYCQVVGASSTDSNGGARLGGICVAQKGARPSVIIRPSLKYRFAYHQRRPVDNAIRRPPFKLDVCSFTGMSVVFRSSLSCCFGIILRRERLGEILRQHDKPAAVVLDDPIDNLQEHAGSSGSGALVHSTRLSFRYVREGP